MISIFLLYNPERLSQLKKCIACLEDLELYCNCQKILCVDGKTNYTPNDFAVIEIPRTEDGAYCWANAWNTGVQASQYDKILYLDADRILPRKYLREVLSRLNDETILYSEKLFYVDDLEASDLKAIRDNAQDNTTIKNIYPDFRISYPPDLEYIKIGKNCMSGNTAFTKTFYKNSGGVDPWYKGYGAVDKDFYLTAYKMGCNIETIPGVELHIKHGPLNGHYQMRLESLFNNTYLARKWNMKFDKNLLDRLDEYNLTIDFINKHKNLSDFLKAYAKN